MSKRLNEERQKLLEPQRMEYAIGQLHLLGIKSIVVIKENCIEFDFKNERVKLFPYSGWFTGKSIRDGRGLSNLLNQLK
jgi:hypothetical protein